MAKPKKLMRPISPKKDIIDMGCASSRTATSACQRNDSTKILFSESVEPFEAISKAREALGELGAEIERTRRRGDTMQENLDPPLPPTTSLQRVPPPPPKVESMLREEGVCVEADDDRMKQLNEIADTLALMQNDTYAQSARQFVENAGIVSALVQMVAKGAGDEDSPDALRAYIACEAARTPTDDDAQLYMQRIKEAEQALRAYGKRYTPKPMPTS